MSSFTDPLTVIKLSNNTWEVAREFKYFVNEENSIDVITIRQGFCTDFASVPRLFWWLFPPDGKYTQAAVVHDFLYSIKGQTRSSFTEPPVILNGKNRARRECDDIFLEAMGVLNVSVLTRHTMYRAVRMFGWIPWKK